MNDQTPSVTPNWTQTYPPDPALFQNATFERQGREGLRPQFCFMPRANFSEAVPPVRFQETIPPI
jgi:hypothetical protein